MSKKNKILLIGLFVILSIGIKAMENEPEPASFIITIPETRLIDRNASKSLMEIEEIRRMAEKAYKRLEELENRQVIEEIKIVDDELIDSNNVDIVDENEHFLFATTENWWAVQEANKYIEELIKEIGLDEYRRRQIEDEMRLDEAIKKQRGEIIMNPLLE